MPGLGCGPERIRMPEEKRGEPKDGAEDLPPAAHPKVRRDEPKPLDDMPVPPLTEPSETKGG